MDALTEHPNQIGWTPYHFSYNNPVNFVDPDGNCPSCWEFTKGVGRGVSSGAQGTWNFLTNDAWKADTWKATGNFVLGAAISGSSPGAAASLPAIDAALGTNTQGAMQAVNQAIEEGVDKFVNGSAGDRGEVAGQALWGVFEAVIGSKGAGAITKAGTATKLASKVDDVTKVYRVYGGKAKPDGFSWTPENPNSVLDFRDAAGLPNSNTGRFVIEGQVNKSDIIKQRSALPLDGNKGGLQEYIIDPSNVQIKRVSGVNPDF